MDENVSRVDAEKRVSAVNLPNALTVLRLVLVPVFLFLKLQEAWEAQWWALGVFAVAAITDRLDGRIARARGLVTDFGKIVDPIADKALTLSAFVIVSWEGILPWWVTILIAVRELGITVWRAVLLRRGIVVAANSGGKLKTVLQIGALLILLVPWGHFVDMDPANLGWARIATYIGLAVAGMALGITLWSGYVYVREGVRLSTTGVPEESSDVPVDAAAEGGSGVEAASDEPVPSEGDSGTSDGFREP